MAAGARIQLVSIIIIIIILPSVSIPEGGLKIDENNYY